MLACGSEFLMRYDLDFNGTLTRTEYLVNTQTGDSYLKSKVNGKDFAVKLTEKELSGTIGLVNINRTDDKKTVGGFNCELLKIQHRDGSTTEAWITEESGFDMSEFAHFIKDDAASSALKKLGIKACPIQSTTKDKNGVETYSFTVTEIQRTAVDKELFKVPTTLLQTK